MRTTFVALCVAVCSIGPAAAQVSIGIGLPDVSIGINVPVYPELVRVPGYPVYYAPRLRSNYFFYDGMYWIYREDNWYASSWYNGPWALVNPDAVPLYILRVPVRYYRAAPAYFRGWSSDAPPRWGDHWGNGWSQRRGGWDRWDRRSVPSPAPLPAYQRQYSGNRYPSAPAQQQQIQTNHYRYQPRDAVVQQHYRAQGAQMPTAATPAGQRARIATPRTDRSAGATSALQQRSSPPSSGRPPPGAGNTVQSAAPRASRNGSTVSRPDPSRLAAPRPQQAAGPRGANTAQRARGPEAPQAHAKNGGKDNGKDKGTGQEPVQTRAPTDARR